MGRKRARLTPKKKPQVVKDIDRDPNGLTDAEWATMEPDGSFSGRYFRLTFPAGTEFTIVLDEDDEEHNFVEGD